ncbi:MAG: hypothetical protein IAX21_06455 [Candidatus Bathyarchaeota archaeon]|nr:hypothetical protein [Candidatus Bathyarchaeum tardum]WGM89406.1 MAG: hypothetical protein NUK63_10975 [Candidatus Bathyarchaeum tardum]WNZ28313.1 MAG: hypothetical protein IAX21_06455 [Candidatus Bathyarchaeota archaeon]
MKIRITLLAIALTGLIAGIAFAGPLVLSELDVRPWTHHVQGETVDFEIAAIFANFTVVNPESEVTDMSINYQVWINITNPSELGATLRHLDFAAAEEITAFSGYPLMGTNSSGGWGWKAEGALVDGKWYNLTWVNGTYPHFDRDGNMEPSLFEIPWQTGYWMEGVQLCQRHVGGTVVATYLNMNGTWTDVTGRIEIEDPEPGNGFMVKNSIANQFRIFQTYMPGFTDTEDEDNNIPDFLLTDMEILCGDGYFDNYWEPGESRIILVEGTQRFGSWTKFSPVDLLDSGTIYFKTSTANSADIEFWLGNNTVQDNWSDSAELKSVELTKVNNSYLYNMDLLEEYSFTVDQWNAEVFLAQGE